jgi:hypothetical protein
VLWEKDYRSGRVLQAQRRKKSKKLANPAGILQIPASKSQARSCNPVAASAVW